MFLTSLLAMGFAALATLVITFAVLKFKDFLKRMKDKLKADSGQKIISVTEGEARKRLAEMMENQQKESTTMTMADLDALMGKNGLITGVVQADGTVKPEDIDILKADEIDDEMRNFQQVVNQKGGTLTLAC